MQGEIGHISVLSRLVAFMSVLLYSQPTYKHPLWSFASTFIVRVYKNNNLDRLLVWHINLYQIFHIHNLWIHPTCLETCFREYSPTCAVNGVAHSIHIFQCMFFQISLWSQALFCHMCSCYCSCCKKECILFMFYCTVCFRFYYYVYFLYPIFLFVFLFSVPL